MFPSSFLDHCIIILGHSSFNNYSHLEEQNSREFYMKMVKKTNLCRYFLLAYKHLLPYNSLVALPNL